VGEVLLVTPEVVPVLCVVLRVFRCISGVSRLVSVGGEVGPPVPLVVTVFKEDSGGFLDTEVGRLVVLVVSVSGLNVSIVGTIRDVVVLVLVSVFFPGVLFVVVRPTVGIVSVVLV